MVNPPLPLITWRVAIGVGELHALAGSEARDRTSRRIAPRESEALRDSAVLAHSRPPAGASAQAVSVARKVASSLVHAHGQIRCPVHAVQTAHGNRYGLRGAAGCHGEGLRC